MADTLSQFLQQFITEERLDRFNEILANRTRHLSVVLENVFHAHNASACLRTCDCFGIQDVHIIESHNRFEPNTEVALGASNWLSVSRYRGAGETPSEELRPDSPESIEATLSCIRSLHDQGYRVLATSPRQNSISLDDLKIDRKTAVIFGAEQMGVSDAAIEHADDLIHIPMFGFTESFNISVSVAIILRHLTTAMRLSDLDWHLTPDEQATQLEDWVRQSLGSKAPPLERRFAQLQAAKNQ